MNEPENIIINCEECGAKFQTAKELAMVKKLCGKCLSAPTTTICFINELHSRIDYFRKEFDLTYAQALGGLEIVKFDILQEMSEDAEDEIS